MKHKGTKLIIAGAALLVLSLGLFAYNIVIDYLAGKAADSAASAVSDKTGTVRETNDAGEDIIPDYILNPEMDMPCVTIDGVDYIGTVNLPSIGLKLPVAAKLTMPVLKNSPCRYSGSAYLDNMVIAAHNYRSYFRDLQKLSSGDTVIFTDTDGNEFKYSVKETETLQPTEIHRMTSYKDGLTLFTCTYSGRARVTVRCERMKEEPLTS